MTIHEAKRGGRRRGEIDPFLSLFCGFELLCNDSDQSLDSRLCRVEETPRNTGRVLIVASHKGQFSAGVPGTDVFRRVVLRIDGESGGREWGLEDSVHGEGVELCRKLLILPELTVAHPLGGTPSPESSSAPKLPGGKPSPAKPFLGGVDVVLPALATSRRNPEVSVLFIRWPGNRVSSWTLIPSAETTKVWLSIL